MAKTDCFNVTGEVVTCLPNTTFKVKLENNTIITATLSGKIRLNYIRIIPGDKVVVEISPYDLMRGRIVYRNK